MDTQRAAGIVRAAAILLAGVLGTAAAHALDQQALQRLSMHNACRGCDLSGAELPGARLSGTDLAGASLDGADLRRAVLSGVDLSNASLRDVDISGGLIENTWLRGAELSGLYLAGTVFRGADLSGALGLSQPQLDQACDDPAGGGSTLPIPYALPPCR